MYINYRAQTFSKDHSFDKNCFLSLHLGGDHCFHGNQYFVMQLSHVVANLS